MPEPPPDPALRPDAEELRLFAERIERSLRERPLDLDAGDHSRRVAALLREIGSLSHYQLLAVGASASQPEVHEGYERTARLVHPTHATRLGLDGREGVLEVLFERATQAYLVLSQPERRKLYDRELDPEAWSRAPGSKSRADELRERARSYYIRAQALAASEEYHFVVELLRDAVRFDPRAEYYALLGEAQAMNVRWLHHAAESYRKALELGGANPAIEAALQKVEGRMAAAAGLAAKEKSAGERGGGSESSPRGRRRS
jgi:curved DNA-binding protein CbpA